MIKRSEYLKAQHTAADLLTKTGIHLNDSEFDRISVADFGLSNLKVFGAQILTLLDTEKVAVKLITLHPSQTLPEHWHPKIGDYEGKEETIRVEWGELYVYAPGEPTPNPRAVLPAERLKYFQSWHESILLPGDMRIFAPKTPHWFQAGSQGAVVWSFSSQVLDLKDEFTDPLIKRETIIIED
jgi:D-lyxose ketol-isomerase